MTVLSQWHLNCLLNSLLRLTTKKTSKFSIIGFLAGESTVTSGFHYRGPVMRKSFVHGVTPLWHSPLLQKTALPANNDHNIFNIATIMRLVACVTEINTLLYMHYMRVTCFICNMGNTWREKCHKSIPYTYVMAKKPIMFCPMKHNIQWSLFKS